MEMDCKECKTNIPLLAGDDLEPDKIDALRDHVRTCGECSLELKGYVNIKDMLGSMKNLDDIPFNWERFSEETRKKALKSVEERDKTLPRGHFVLFKYAVACSLFVAGMVLFFIGLENNDTLKDSKVIKAGDASSKEREQVKKLQPVSADEVPNWFVIDDGFLDKRKNIRLENDFRVGNEAIAINKGWIGLLVKNHSSGYIMVNDVVTGGPAQDSDLRQGDIIKACNGSYITSALDLKKIINSCEVGESITLTVVRNDQELTIAVDIAKYPHNL